MGFNKYCSVALDIRTGVACDGTPGDILLKNIGTESFWPLNSFGVKNLSGHGARFKVKGKKFSGDVACITLANGSIHKRYCVQFGQVKKKQFVPSRTYNDVPADQLAALLSAVADDLEAEVTVQ